MQMKKNHNIESISSKAKSTTHQYQLCSKIVWRFTSFYSFCGQHNATNVLKALILKLNVT